MKTGAEDWRWPYATSYIGDIAGADTDGDGLPEAIFCRANQLVAVRGATAVPGDRVLWALTLPAPGARPLSPIWMATGHSRYACARPTGT